MNNDLTENQAVRNKAEKSGISYATLMKVYRRGVAAWNSGHRPGTTPEQWGLARVNSYVTKGKGTYYGADKDLHEEELDEKTVAKDKESGEPKKYVAGLSKSTAKARSAHWDKMDKLDDRDPRAYEPAPGDATAKTKPSKHTMKFKQMYGEEVEPCCEDCVEPIQEEAEYEGRKVTLNKPFGGDSKHKRYVYVKNEKGNIIKLGFGDPNMEIKRDDPERRKAYRARHNCDNPGPKWKANYWSCKYWSATPTSKLDEDKEYGFEGDMAISQLRTIMRNAEHLAGMLEPDTDLPEWVQSKITLATDYIVTAHNYMMSEMERVPEQPRNPAIIPRGYEKMKKENWAALIPKSPMSLHQFEKSLDEGVHRDRADALISKEKNADTLKFDRMRDTADSQDDSEQKRIKAKIKEDTSVSIPLYVQEAAYEGNIGMMELAKFYMKASDSDKKKLQDAIKNKRFKEAWKMVERVTGVKLVGKEFSEASSPAQQAAIAIAKKKKEGVSEQTTVYVPNRFKRSEDSIYDAIHKAHGSPANHNIGIEFNNGGKREVHVNGKKHSQLTTALNKHLDNVKEEVAANSVAGGGVDMNPTGKPKWDKRSKFHIDHMFRRADGTKYKKEKKD